MAKNSAERASSGSMATLLMIVALVATVGLLVWLSFASRPPEGPAMVMNDDAEGTVDTGPTAPTVTAADFGADVAGRVGQEVNLAGVMVSNVVNDQLIWVDVPTAQGNTPFTVHLLPGAAATLPANQSMVNVEGMVLAKTDSVLDAWEQAGSIPDANVRASLEFGGHFIEARAIRPAGQ